MAAYWDENGVYVITDEEPEQSPRMMLMSAEAEDGVVLMSASDEDDIATQSSGAWEKGPATVNAGYLWKLKDSICDSMTVGLRSNLGDVFDGTAATMPELLKTNSHAVGDVFTLFETATRKVKVRINAKESTRYWQNYSDYYFARVIITDVHDRVIFESSGNSDVSWFACVHDSTNGRDFYTAPFFMVEPTQHLVRIGFFFLTRDTWATPETVGQAHISFVTTANGSQLYEYMFGPDPEPPKPRYRVQFGNTVLYDPKAGAFELRDTNLHLGVGEPGSMSFTIDYDHPAYSQLTKMINTLEVQIDDEPIYRGRIIRDEKDFYNSLHVETEGILAALNDSIIPPFKFPQDFLTDQDYQTAAATGNVVAYLLGWVIDQHNAQVASDRQFDYGTVTVTAPNNYLELESTDYTTAWDIVKNKILGGALGGYLLPRYAENSTYIDFLSAFTLTNAQPVEFGENLLNLTSKVDATTVYSAILPIGKDGLTIESLADGDISPGIVKAGKIIYSTAAEETYGYITRAVTWSDATTATDLRTRAVAELTGAGVLMADTLTINACDLHVADYYTAAFRIGRNVQVTSAPHGISRSFALVELDMDLLNPANASITLGSTTLTQTEANRASQATVAQQIEQQKVNTEQLVAEVSESTSQQITEAVQTAQSIIFGALEDYVSTGDFTTYQQTVSSSLAVLSSSINLNITQVTTQLSQVGNDLQKQINEITKYFRFTSDGLLIGETGNEVLLRLDNDLIQFLRGNVPGLWMDEEGLHASSVGTERLQIGNAEVVNENGRLTIRKAVNS